MRRQHLYRTVILGLDPRISCHVAKDARVKPEHDDMGPGHDEKGGE
jgi:hypothetical protein